MNRSAMIAIAIAIVLPAPAIAQDPADQTGSISTETRENVLSEEQARTKLINAGFTAIGTMQLDLEGVWRTTAMKGNDMMSVAITRKGDIED